MDYLCTDLLFWEHVLQKQPHNQSSKRKLRDRDGIVSKVIAKHHKLLYNE
jgi:hypothetical protein